jgi:hypothetical protein
MHIFAFKYNNLHLFYFIVLVLEVVRNDGDAIIEHSKISVKIFIFLTYHMYLTYPSTR